MRQYESKEWSKRLKQALRSEICSPSGKVVLSRLIVDPVAISSGKIAACDPLFANFGADIFSQEVPKGLFDVYLSVATESGRIAMATPRRKRLLVMLTKGLLTQSHRAYIFDNSLDWLAEITDGRVLLSKAETCPQSLYGIN